ncbi:MAG: hypothetical protein IIW81_00265, partial [Oscillospiraceae bacterium]|nr:hypothetical protein [Oscillospiraceae bacterium]
THDRQILYDRIEKRIDQMMEEGLLAEVDKLLKMGYDPELVRGRRGGRTSCSQQKNQKRRKHYGTYFRNCFCS